MAKTIQELRKEAGYRSGREFAAKLGVSPSTYSRYEASPDSIPLKAAWAMADLLGCSIDMVVGREHVEVSDMRGSVQKVYDRLSDDMKLRVDEYLEFIAHLQVKEDRRRRERAEAEQMQRVQTLERMFFSEMLENPDTRGDFLFWDAAKTRKQFEAYVRSHISGLVADRRAEVSRTIEVGLRKELGLVSTDKDGVAHCVKDSNPERERAISESVEEATDLNLREFENEVIGGIMANYDKLHPQSGSFGMAPNIAVEYMGGDDA